MYQAIIFCDSTDAAFSVIKNNRTRSVKLQWCIRESLNGKRIIAQGYKWLCVKRFNGKFFEPAVAGIPEHALSNGPLGSLKQVHVLTTTARLTSINTSHLTFFFLLYTVFPASRIRQGNL